MKRLQIKPVLFLTIAATAGALASSCSSTGIIKDNVQGIEIVTPVANASLGETDDLDTATLGIQYNVKVRVSGVAKGTTVYLTNSRSTTVVSAEVSQGVAEFPSYTLASGDIKLRVAFEEMVSGAVCDGTECAEVSISVAESGGPVIQLTFPTEGAELSNATFEAKVAASGTPLPESCELLVDGQVLGNPVAWSDAVDNVLTLDGTVTEGGHTIGARCEALIGKTDTASVTVLIDDTAPAAPAFVNEEVGNLGIGESPLIFDSANRYVNGTVADVSSDAGLQHNLNLALTTIEGETNTGYTVVVEMTLDDAQGGQTASQQLVLPAQSAGATITSFNFGTADGNLTLRARVVDRAGNASQDAIATFIVDTTPPALTQTSPDTALMYYDLRSDGDTDATYVNLPFVYSVNDGVGGADCAANPEFCVALTVTPTSALTTTAADYPIDPSDQTMYLPFLDLGSANVVSFVRNNGEKIGFSDGNFSAIATISDAAGNVATAAHSFEVKVVLPNVAITFPAGNPSFTAADDTSTATGFQTNFGIYAQGFEQGVPVNICSTIAPASMSNPVACRWGSDGQPGGTNAGFVVGSGVLVQAGSIFEATILNVTLAEGVQVVHAEAKDADDDPDAYSLPFATYTVDSSSPDVTDFSLLDNSLDSGSVVILNASEGVVGAGTLTTNVSVTVTGVEDGQTVSVYSNVPATNTLVGQSTISSGAAAFTVDLNASATIQSLYVSVSDLAGNTNNTSAASATQSVYVDIAAGSVAVAAPGFSPYTAANGTLNDAGTSDTSDDTLEISIAVNSSDDGPLLGGEVRLARYSDAGGLNLIGGSTQTVPLTTSELSTSTLVTFSLPVGSHHLKAELVDGAGNSAASSVVWYNVDLYGPTLTLEVRNGSAVDMGCGDSNSPCDADVQAPVANRFQLDTSAGTDYCPPLHGGTCPPFAEAGTDILYTLGGCQNSDSSIEDCSSSPISVYLESKLTSGGSFATVYQSTFSANGDVGSMRSIFSDAASYAFDVGIVREVRLVAVDGSGNQSVSNSVFFKFNVGGVTIEAERMNAGLTLTGDNLADNAKLNASTNLSVVPGEYATNYQVQLTAVSGEVPTSVEVAVTGANPTVTRTVGSVVDGGGGTYTAIFSGADEIPLNVSAGPSNTNASLVTITVYCGANTCGTRDYSSVVADIDAPTFQFDRCSLCALNVPIEGSASHCVDATSCAAANSADAADLIGVSPASWNVAGDQDSNSGNGFSITGSPTSLVVLLNGAEDGQLVTLSSTPAGLSGNTALTTGCEDGNPSTPCAASFSTLNVPSLTSNGVHNLTVSVTDSASNPGVAETIRSTEVLNATTDLDAPATAAPTICMGENTAPTDGSTPNANTAEDASCGAICTSSTLCDRRNGRVTLAWTAPGEDSADGGSAAATSYQILVAGLGVSYPGLGTPYSSCSELVMGGVAEQTLSYSPTAGVGATETYTISGLNLHRDYCFAVSATDDVGNESSVVANQVSRVIPILNNIPGSSEPPYIVSFAGADQGEADSNSSSFYSTAGNYLALKMANLGDIDGDSQDDFAGSYNNYSDTAEVRVFLSSSGSLMSPAVTITTPSNCAANAGLFGRVVGGNFDGDAFSDLVITAPFCNAIYIYYGNSGFSKSTNSSDDDLPSLTPDVTLFGPAGSYIGYEVVMGDFDGVNGDDLFIMNTSFAGTNRGYGFVGGSPTRFTATPAVGTKVNLDLDTLDGSENSPDFSVQPKATGAASFPSWIGLADLDGDTILDVLISDKDADHDTSGTCNDCGEIYVYKGGAASLTGAIVAPTDAGTADSGNPLMHILRGTGNHYSFGGFFFRVPAPRPGDNADWLVVNSGESYTTLIKGSDGSNDVLAAAFAPGGVGVTYDDLDRNTNGGTPLSNLGKSFGFLGDFDGHGGVDFALGQEFQASGPTYVALYSFEDFGNVDATDDTFVKRSVIVGPGGFGNQICSVGSYFGSSSGLSGGFVVSSSAEGRFHYYR